MPRRPLLIICVFAALHAFAAQEPAASRIDFYDDIKPLLAIHCTKCHGADSAKGGLRLDTREHALAPAESGAPPIVAGDAARSTLLRRITSQDPDELMPKKSARLSAAEIERFRAWIEQGASWPGRDDYWAFQPPRAVEPPPLARANPIDRFIDARLESAKIAPAPRADSRTLLRRAFADLIGVPPSIEEANAFLNDTAPDAFEKLIDRLLADPRYGERWARHWLDLARYSESDGFEDDKIRPHAWRYRDYVIRALNADKPYDRFVQEQLAGDALWPDDPDALIATGFARLGAWDGMSKDPPRQRQDFLNDATDAVGSVFLGMTIGCARCHDHKYDRITQQDYYGLQAFFAGAKRESHELKGELREPPGVTGTRQKTQAALSLARNERDGILREAHEKLQWDRRCEAADLSQLKIDDAQIKAQANRLHPGRLADLDKKIKEWDPIERLHRAAAEAVLGSAVPAPKTFLLKGGELSRPGPEVAPHFIEALNPKNPEPENLKPENRVSLARWLTSAANPLTARVMVNRIWQHHFGRGIVATPSDFGRHGQRPAHPELLDWLACRFVADGWSLKKMHRLIMTSAAYQRSSGPPSTALSLDPDNKLLGRMSPRRLEGEAIRDSILAVSGRLSRTMGGPGVYPRISKDVNVQFPNNDKELSWYSCTEEENCRRTIYIFQRRSLTFPLVDVFDGAAMSQSCPIRAETTVAPQALTLLNGEFCREEARRMAERVVALSGADTQARIECAFRLAFARLPSPTELAAAKAFLIKQSQTRPSAKSAEANSAAFADLCHVLLNANEFIFLD